MTLRDTPPPQRTSDILAGLFQGDPEARITFGMVVDALENRAFGLLILIFALPNAVPGPPLPGFSALLAAPIMLLGGEMLLGRRQPWFPGWLRRLSFRRGNLAGAVQRGLPWLKQLERLFRCRWTAFTGRTAERGLGAVMILLGFAMGLPIPLGTMLPAWSLMILSLGLIEGDGGAIIFGLFHGLVGLAWLALLLILGGEAIAAIFG